MIAFLAAGLQHRPALRRELLYDVVTWNGEGNGAGLHLWIDNSKLREAVSRDAVRMARRILNQNTVLKQGAPQGG